VLSLPLRPENFEEVGDGDRVLRRAFAAAPQRLLPANAPLVGEGARREHAVLIRHGWAASVRTLPDGRRIIPEVHLPGDVVGLDVLLRPRADHGIRALTPLVYHALPRNELQALCGALSLSVLDHLLRDYERVRALAELLARASAEERLAAFLVSLHDRLKRRQLVASQSFRLPMTQQDIGDHLGLTVVHVNRVLQRLGQQGIVAREQRRLIRLRDLDRLVALAGNAVARREAPSSRRPSLREAEAAR
jgi:CRP-like cAMP-binding protein